MPLMLKCLLLDIVEWWMNMPLSIKNKLNLRDYSRREGAKKFRKILESRKEIRVE